MAAACRWRCAADSARAATAPAAPLPQSYTPRHLAEKILRSRPSLEGERKQVTALFADVVDSTPLAERLGPEETHALIRRCFDLMLEAVHRYEGTVSQFTGDGILALFGAPIAHEDHAQRAVRAALAIQQALRDYQRELQEQRGIAFQVRIGLNSGPVVVGTIGTDLNMTYTAIGDTVNLASRIQGLAEPGTVVISEATQRLVGGYFVTRDLGQHQVKGKAEADRRLRGAAAEPLALAARRLRRARAEPAGRARTRAPDAARALRGGAGRATARWSSSPAIRASASRGCCTS